MVEKIDANAVGFAIAEEETPKVLPANPSWFTREPNSFDDLGGEYALVARRPFSPSRQRKKGSTVDLDVDGGFSEDLTQNNMQWPLQGFFFADLRAKPASVNVAAVAATDDFTVDSTADMLAGHILFAQGFAVNANNGLHVVDAVTDGTHVSTADPLTDAAAAAGQTVKVVGYQFPADDVSIALVGGKAVMTSAAVDMESLDLIPGEWVFVGGDAAGNQFGAVTAGYARIAEITEETISFDKTTFTVGAGDDGAGTTLRMFFGDVLKNEDDPDLIVKRTYQVERTLGRDDDGRQAEYLTGATPNELSWNSPLADKVTLDLGFIGLAQDFRTGAIGPKSSDGGATLVSALGEDAFNTSQNVFQLRMNIIDPDTLNPTPLFARVTEWSATINNNVSAAKSQGTLGGFDTTAGNFDVDLEVTAYFTTVEAVQAIRDNADVTFHAIYSKRNAAVILDLPLIGLGGGRLQVEQDAAIMVPLENAAAESSFGHTLLLNWLPYVPNAGVA